MPDKKLEIPVISVLMPVYNGELHLREAIDSILGQSLRNFDFVIIDDGSTDDTSKILNAFSEHDTRIKILSQKHKGLSHSINRGLSKIETPFIARMDSDDVAHPERLAIQVSFMEKHPAITVCGSALEVYEQPGVCWRPPQRHEEIIARQLFENPIFHPTVIFRNFRDRYRGILYNEAFNKAQDYDLWVRLSNQSGHLFANLPEPLIRHRTYPGNDRSRHRQEQQASANIVRKNILRTLGINCSKEEYDLHQFFLKFPRRMDKVTLYRCSKWLTVINNSNISKKIFERNALQDELRKRWKRLCLSVSEKLAMTPLLFLKSEWGQGSLANWIDAGRMVYRNIKNKIEK